MHSKQQWEHTNLVALIVRGQGHKRLQAHTRKHTFQCCCNFTLDISIRRSLRGNHTRSCSNVTSIHASNRQQGETAHLRPSVSHDKGEDLAIQRRSGVKVLSGAGPCRDDRTLQTSHTKLVEIYAVHPRDTPFHRT